MHGFGSIQVTAQQVWGKAQESEARVTRSIWEFFRFSCHAFPVTAWVREFNPNCEIFCENLPFTDLVEDWKTVCLAFGQPLVIDSADFSCTCVLRAYWSNMRLPSSQEELTRGFAPANPNQYMRTSRTAEPYTMDDKTTARTIGAPWIGDPNHPKADTRAPVLVHNQQLIERYEQPQSLQAEEAEMLIGYPEGSTSGRAVTQIDRLRSLGDSWDIRTSLMLNRVSKHATIRVDGPLSVLSQSSGRSAKQALLAGLKVDQMPLCSYWQHSLWRSSFSCCSL